MKILITGAFGFVGSNLSNSLNKNIKAELIAIDVYSSLPLTYNSFFTWKQLNKINWKDIDVIIHLAGKAHDTNNASSEKSYFDVNLGLTQKIFAHFLKSNASKFIFFSSVKAVADSVTGELTEKHTPVPQTAYGRSKYEAERFILSHSLPTNKKVYILRPCMIHGPGNKGNLNLLHKMVSSGIPWPLGKFENNRSFTSIDNLIFIVEQIIKKEIEPGIYQVADDECISTNRLIALIGKSQDKKVRIWNVNKKLMEGIAVLGSILRLPLNRERIKKLTESYVVSNKKIKHAIGIEKLHVGAEDGIMKTLSSFQTERTQFQSPN